MLILDQNITFEDTDCVYGTDICKQLRQELGFTGVITIRSGNDSLQDREKYKNAGHFAFVHVLSLEPDP